MDSRAWGGYAVAPGSTTPDGDYRVIESAPPAPLPDWLHDALSPPPPIPTVAAFRPSAVCAPLSGRAARYVNAAVRNETIAVLTAVAGTRHDTLLRAAVALGRLAAAGALDSTAVRADLLAAAAVHEPHGFTRAEAERTVDDALAWAATRPRRLPSD